MQYNDLVTALAAYLQEEMPSTAYTTALPTIIRNGELRCYRDLDLHATSAVNSSLVFTPGSRTLSLSNMTGQTLNGLPVAFPYPTTVEGLNAILPAWQAPAYGTRIRFLPVSYAFIDAVWPNEQIVSPPGVPFAYFAMLDDQTVIVAPTPDQQYGVEIKGSWRPASLSPTTPESWLGDHMGDLLFDACMVEATGYQRDYGAASDDPRQALSWEARYQSTLTKCREEEVRRVIGRTPPVPFPMAAATANPPPGRGQ